MRFGRFAKGRPKPAIRGAMNGQEREYAGMLERRRLAGEVVWYAFTPISMKLAEDTRYTPDFAVMLADGTFELHEVKGWMEEAAFVRIKVAEEKYPFRFVLARKRAKKLGGGWEIKVVGEDSISGAKPEAA